MIVIPCMTYQYLKQQLKTSLVTVQADQLILCIEKEAVINVAIRVLSVKLYDTSEAQEVEMIWMLFNIDFLKF